MDITNHINSLRSQILALNEHMEYTNDPAELASLKAQVSEVKSQLNRL
jgi:hypothetical protein